MTARGAQEATLRLSSRGTIGPPSHRNFLRRSVGGPMVDRVHQEGDVVDRRLRQDPVAEVEDMAGTAAGLLQHLVDHSIQRLARGEERHWIEVPLYRPVGMLPPQAA